MRTRIAAVGLLAVGCGGSAAVDSGALDVLADTGTDAPSPQDALDVAADVLTGLDARADAGGLRDALDGSEGRDGGPADSGLDAGGATRCPGPTVVPEPTERVFVAPGGNDSAAGTMAAPLATLSAAARRLPTGGTVVVRGGRYGQQRLAAQGSAGHPLFIRAADGEVPVFDGAAVTGSYNAVLALSSASHVVIQGLEIGNCHASNCAAIQSGPVLDLAVVGCHLHDLDGTAARFAGSTIRFEGNHIHDVALTNVNNTAYPNGGWPTCMGTQPNNSTPATPLADGVVIRDNVIENCWGEGIGLWFATHALVEGNVVVNSFNVGIYMDNSPSVTVTRNFVHVTRGIHGSQGSGILMGTEPYASWTASPCADITVSDNVVVAGAGISWWHSPDTTAANTYQRVAVAHNTVVSTAGGALSFAAVGAGAPAPSGCTARNNVFSESSGAFLANAGAWSLASNAWLNGPRPGVAGATDVVVSATVPAITAATDVERLVSLVGTGVPGTGVTLDYACNARDPAAPRRGAFER